MYVLPTDNTGQIHAVVDGSQLDVAALQAQLRAMGTANGYDFSGATVTLGSGMVIS